MLTQRSLYLKVNTIKNFAIRHDIRFTELSVFAFRHYAVNWVHEAARIDNIVYRGRSIFYFSFFFSYRWQMERGNGVTTSIGEFGNVFVQREDTVCGERKYCNSIGIEH